MDNKQYPYIKLNKLCDVNQGLQIPISERFLEKGKDRYFYITVQFLKDSHKNKFYVENPPKSSICNKDDILVVRTGSTGQVITGVEGCFHNNFFKVNYTTDLIYGRYLFYCLTTKEKYYEMLTRAGLTTIPDLNHFMFLDIAIPLPSKEVQLGISNILDSLSYKIQLNARIIAKLEAMAKTLYDYWFVQFDFPDENNKPYKNNGGKMEWHKELKMNIPDGWAVKKVEKVATVKAGGDRPKLYSLEKTAICSIPIYSNGITNNGLYGYTNEATINSPSVTISARGTIGYCALRNIPFVPIVRLIVITPHVLGAANYFYECMKNLKFEKNGSVQQQLTVPQISQLNILYPPLDILKKFDAATYNIISEVEILKEQNQQLTKLRDWLLPMLMSGQIKIK